MSSSLPTGQVSTQAHILEPRIIIPLGYIHPWQAAFSGIDIISIQIIATKAETLNRKEPADKELKLIKTYQVHPFIH